ncbi:MAG TPA: hypothetical protein VFK09_01085 [Gemmatimonadales bacterium]|jgi:hypothetical protein|nr:hypothetical protein [Gemmatimonadales bacterium]
MRFLYLVCLGALLAPTLARAQERRDPDRWQVTLDDGRILWDVRLVKLAGDTLQVTRPDSLATVSVAHVTEIRLIKKSDVDLGTGAGTMNALMGTDDEVYDLTPLDFADRLRAVQKLFLYHPPEGSAAGP